MKEIKPVDPREEFEKDFENIFNDSLIPVEWEVEKRDRANQIIDDARVSTSRFASIPMECRGSACLAHKRCPLYQENLHPYGEICPIEAKLVARLVYDMMDELEVDPASTIEVGMIRDLVDQEIQQLRKQNLLSREDIIQENVIGVDDNGEPIMKKELHLAIDWEDKIHKRKAALLKQLLATRESRVNAGAKVLDQATNMSVMLSNYAKLQKNDQKVLNQLGLGPKDDYIEAQEALVKDDPNDVTES